MIQRAFRYRLYPTPEQALLMERTAGAVRFVYNLALEQRRDFYRQAKAVGHRFDYVSQGHEVTQLRAEVDWLAACHSTPLTQALRDLDRAFTNFFRGAGFPSFRSKDKRCSFRHRGVEIKIRSASRKWALIRVPKLGFVRMRLTRQMRGRIVSATFSRAALGWHVSIACEIKHEAPANDLPPIGIDRGIANTIALSNGELLSLPDLSHLERRKRKAQRVLARRKRGSARYTKQRRRVSSLAAKIARCRADWRHKATTRLADRFGFIGLEALNVANMTASGAGKRGLNRSILEQGWTEIERLLAYKLEERGGTLAKINPVYTSQECSSCGTIDKRSRENQARFACRHCGFRAHADTNAALNILRRSTAVVEGRGCAPVEARTLAHAA